MTDRGKIEGDAVDAAIGWHLRLPSATREEWQDFIAWLEADPAHAAAYDRLTLDDELLAPSLLETPAPVPQAANDAGPPARRWRPAVWVGPGIAAAGAVALVVGLPGSDATGGRTIETGPGQRKQVAFADGSRITLNGGTRLLLERGNPRFAALEAGEATFEIKHDATNPFIVKSGALTLHDLGTTFNVARLGRRLGVQVSEGAVLFEPQREALTIRPGVALSVDETGRKVVFSRVATSEVGGWRHGRLSFGAERLADVAAAISRATGTAVTVAPALADTPFTGSLRVHAARPAATIERIAALSGNRAVRDGDAWMIVPIDHASD